MIFAAGSALDHVMDDYTWHFVHEYAHFSIPLGKYGSFEFLSKYSIIMMIAAGLILAIYIPLAKKIQSGEAPKGRFWNLFEALLTFIRDNVAKPYIGKDADLYVHFLWTVFLFVLFCNLLGMIPFFGSPTASFTVTFVLAVSVFLFIHINSVMRFGFKTHLLSFAPHLDMPFVMKLVVIPMIWAIEFFGLALKCCVLAVRLFANMFAGHIVLGTIMLFIPMVRNMGWALESTVTLASVFGVIALSLLELFVAFLQAFIFTFLTALFFGGILEHAEHTAHASGHGGHDHHDHNHHEHAASEKHSAPAVSGSHH